MAINPNEFTLDAMLADSTVVSDGKLFIQGGGWSTIGTPAFPFRQARIGLALIVGVPYVATNRTHSLAIKFEGDDGPIPIAKAASPDGDTIQTVTAIGSQFNVGRPANIQPGDRQFMSIAMNFDAMVFEQAGLYTFIFEIDGEEVNRLPFRVSGPPALMLSP